MLISFLDGGNLEEALASKKDIPLFVRNKWALQAASGLAWLHGSGVLHLDIKPANMLLKDNVVKLCDFGLSKILPVGKHFKKSKARGTPLFTAPEIFMGDPFDHSADVYSFGITLFCLVSREKPLAHLEFDTKEAFLKAVCPPSNTRPKMNSPDFSPALMTLCRWAWDDKPALRPSMPQVIEKLESILIASAIADETAALSWSRCCEGAGVKEVIVFDDLFVTICEIVKLKKKNTDSQSAKIFRMCCNALEGEVDILSFGRSVSFLGSYFRVCLHFAKQ